MKLTFCGLLLGCLRNADYFATKLFALVVEVFQLIPKPFDVNDGVPV